VRAFEDLEPLAAELEHFRHEGKPFELGVRSKRGQNLLLASDLDPLSGFEL
jgi:hypothetical protein